MFVKDQIAFCADNVDTSIMPIRYKSTRVRRKGADSEQKRYKIELVI